MPPLDARVWAAILVMGLASVAIKAYELWRWYAHEEPTLIDTQTNGGAKSTAWSGTSQTR